MPKRLRRPSHPGEILKSHYLVPREMSQKCFADSIEVSEKHLSQIINGHRRLEADVATRIAKALKTTTDFWLNLQKACDVWDAEELQDNVCCKISEPIINVYDALGFDNSEMMQAKAEIAHAISSIIRHRHLTQKEAAKALCTTQPWVSAVVNGCLGDLSLERLIALINKLDRDVEIRIRKKPRTRQRSQVKVSV